MDKFGGKRLAPAFSTGLASALFAYRTAVHSSTGVIPFMLMYGREPSCGICTSPMGYEVNEFPAVLQSRLAKLRDLVKTHNAEAASCGDHRWKED